MLPTKNYKLKTAHGYTLMETLVAITVILLAMVGPMALAAKSLADAQYASDQITAFYLAQEGLEIVRNLHDRNVNNDSWLKLSYQACPDTSLGITYNAVNLQNILNSSGAQSFDVNPICVLPVNLSGLSVHPLYMFATSNVNNAATIFLPCTSTTGCSNAVVSKFTRNITLTRPSSGGPDTLVSVTVSWLNQGVRRNVTLSADLFPI